MTTIEEILIKLGVDKGTLEQDLGQFKQQVGGAAEHAGKSFVKAGSAGKAFKKVLEEVSETSPAMGLALKLALSPIAAMLTGIVLGFAWLKGKIEENEKELDKLGEIFGRKFGSMTEAVKHAADAIERQNRAFHDWLESHQRQSDAINDSLREQRQHLKSNYEIGEKVLEQRRKLALEAIQDAVRQGKMTPQAGAAEANKIESAYAHGVRQLQMDTAAGELAATRQAAADAQAKLNKAAADVDRLNRATNDPTRLALLEDLPKRAEDARRDAKDFQPQLDRVRQQFEADKRAQAATAAENNRYRIGGGQAPDPTKLPSFAALQRAEATMKQFEDAARKAEAQQKSLTKAKEDEEDQLKKAQKAFDDLHSTTKDLNRQQKEADDRLKALGKMPLAVENHATPITTGPGANVTLESLAPSLEQVARSGQWVRGRWRPGPFSFMAQNVMGLKEDATMAMAYGNLSRAQWDIERANSIMGSLRGAGVFGDKAESAEVLRRIESMATTGNFHVTVNLPE